MSLAGTAGLRRSYLAFNAALGSLYENDLLELADATDKPKFDDTAFFDAADRVYNAGSFDASQLNTPEARRLIAETVKQINTAISAGVPHEVPEVVRYALENNAFIFSGFKAFHSLREVGLSLTTDKGDIKPFETFRKDVEQVNNRYNHNYLYAEYNHAVGASLMAARWQQIEADGDRYDLQYRTAQDDRVREDHAILHGTTLPPSDPFWSLYLPPNGWNCRCTAVQVRRGKYPQSDPALSMLRGNNCTEAAKQQIFRFNPGKELQLFPPKHPYYKAPEAAKQVIEQLSEEQKREQRIADIIAELPDSLTFDQKKTIAENCLEIEQSFGITKGKAMTYDQANKGKENPEFAKGGGYLVNCQTCTVTHWLRRLGFNVKAKPNIKGSAYAEMDAQGITWLQRFVNLDGSDVDYDFTSKWQKRKGYKAMTAKRLQEYFTEKFSEDGVYEIYCAWKRRDAHVFCAEVVGGKVRYFDPQSGQDDVSSYIGEMRPGMVGVIRIDDKKVNPKLKNLFLEVK
ncbi:phage minor head protein [uncultured Duncaniella sp.]|jgi:SPP1 gp7 family putative phage head morphogenesis protein|uniref:phage minor head protein n=1 Tax=uncultured Duncaniella sp. TaxID=2768039 RepID=UPI0025A6660B|nr:phage minor head protein [uncultured Duncaniella sp.]